MEWVSPLHSDKIFFKPQPNQTAISHPLAVKKKKKKGVGLFSHARNNI